MKQSYWYSLVDRSELSDEKRMWWYLYKTRAHKDGESESDEDETLDAITKMPMEYPTRLPSGQMVDRATYSMLVSSTGKDPFTMEPLPSPSSFV